MCRVVAHFSALVPSLNGECAGRSLRRFQAPFCGDFFGRSEGEQSRPRVRSCVLVLIFLRLQESGAKKAKVTKCRTVCATNFDARTINAFSHYIIHDVGDMVHFQFNVTKDPKKK